jgi:hypothetical protein
MSTFVDGFDHSEDVDAGKSFSFFAAAKSGPETDETPASHIQVPIYRFLWTPGSGNETGVPTVL